MSIKDFSNNLLKELGGLAGKLLVETTIDNPEITEYRKNQCRGNGDKKPCMFYKKETDQCRVCKCFIEVKSEAKTNFSVKSGEIEITHCPMGWWEDADIAHKYRTR